MGVHHRVLIPTIVLVSFAVTFGLISWRTGLRRPAPADVPPELATPPLPPLNSAIQPEAAPSPSGEALEVTTASVQDEPPSAGSPEPRAAETEVFLAAQDRAAEHSARSH